MVRTRIAPSPTGYPHIATIYQALFDYAFAKRHHGKFIIRIEDTDRERFVSDAEEKLYQAIDWFGLAEDESPRKSGTYAPYKQSERLDIYQKYAQTLLEKGYAYYCFCSKKRLDEVRKKQQSEKKPTMYDKHCRNLSQEEIEKTRAEKKSFVLRLKVPENEQLTVVDEIRGEIMFDTNLIDDQVLMKSDGFPTYHLAVVVDDHCMEISHVVRGEEWISSYPKHILLYRFFSWKHPKFYHTSVLRNPDHSKLSKRQGHTNVTWYQEEGFLPEAILNYIALLGWSHPEEKEIFSLAEFIQFFDLQDVKSIAPIFDLEKLQWMNGVHIRNIALEDIVTRIKTFFPQYVSVDKDTFQQIVSLAQSRMTTLKDFDTLAHHFIEEPISSANDSEKMIAKNCLQKFQAVSAWNIENILIALKEILKENSIRMPVLYILLTGNSRGLPLPETLEILGKEKACERLQKIL